MLPKSVRNDVKISFDARFNLCDMQIVYRASADVEKIENEYGIQKSKIGKTRVICAEGPHE